MFFLLDIRFFDVVIPMHKGWPSKYLFKHLDRQRARERERERERESAVTEVFLFVLVGSYLACDLRSHRTLVFKLKYFIILIILNNLL